MRHWKEILYGVVGLLGLWRIARMSIFDMMLTSGSWYGNGIHKCRMALVFTDGMDGWLYRVREFRFSTICYISSYGYYVRQRLPSRIMNGFNQTGILVNVVDANLHGRELEEMIEAYGDGTEFRAKLRPECRKLVDSLCKAFDGLPEKIDIGQPFKLLHRR